MDLDLDFSEPEKGAEGSRCNSRYKTVISRLVPGCLPVLRSPRSTDFSMIKRLLAFLLLSSEVPSAPDKDSRWQGSVDKRVPGHLGFVRCRRPQAPRGQNHRESSRPRPREIHRLSVHRARQRNRRVYSPLFCAPRKVVKNTVRKTVKTTKQ